MSEIIIALIAFAVAFAVVLKGVLALIAFFGGSIDRESAERYPHLYENGGYDNGHNSRLSAWAYDLGFDRGGNRAERVRQNEALKKERERRHRGLGEL